jgi:hypothetical protein
MLPFTLIALAIPNVFVGIDQPAPVRQFTADTLVRLNEGHTAQIDLRSVGESLIHRSDLLKHLPEDPRGNIGYSETLRIACDPRFESRIAQWIKEERIDLLVEFAPLIVYSSKHRSSIAYAVSCLVKQLYLDTLTAMRPEGAADRIFPRIFKPDLEKFNKILAHDCLNRFPRSSGKYDMGIVFANRPFDWNAHSDNNQDVFLFPHGIARPNIKLDNSRWFYSILVSNRSTPVAAISGCVLIVDGDVRLSNAPLDEYSLILCTGNLISEKKISLQQSYVHAKGTVSAPHPSNTQGSTIFAGEKFDLPTTQQNRMGSHTIDPKKSFGKIRFFTNADVGLALAEKDGKVFVDAVGPASPFRYHLKPGDQILKLNDAAVSTSDAVRRGLRTSCVLEAAWLVYSRGGITYDRTFNLTGYPKPIR